MPEHRASVFSATRSPSNRLRVGPLTCAAATLTLPAGVPGTLSAAVKKWPSSKFHETLRQLRHVRAPELGKDGIHKRHTREHTLH